MRHLLLGSFAAALFGMGVSYCDGDSSITGSVKEVGQDASDSHGIEDILRQNDNAHPDADMLEGGADADGEGTYDGEAQGEDVYDSEADGSEGDGKKDVTETLLSCPDNPVAYLDCMYNGNKGKQRHVCHDGEYVPDPDEGCNYGCVKTEEGVALSADEKYDEFKKGTCSYHSNGELIVEPDVCLQDKVVMEYLCSEQQFCKSLKIGCNKCEGDFTEGACALETAASCVPCIEKENGEDDDCDAKIDEGLCKFEDFTAPDGSYCSAPLASGYYSFSQFPASFVTGGKFYGKLVVSGNSAEEELAAELVGNAIVAYLKKCSSCDSACEQEVTKIYTESEIKSPESGNGPYNEHILLFGTPCSSTLWWEMNEPKKIDADYQQGAPCEQAKYCSPVTNTLFEACGEDAGMLTSYDFGYGQMVGILGDTPTGVLLAASVLANHQKHNLECTIINITEGGESGMDAVLFCEDMYLDGNSMQCLYQEDEKEIECK